MLAVRIIPCLDIENGRVVKGINFSKLRDAGDPVEAAKIYNEEGADEIVFLDIKASSEGRKTLCKLVERVASEINIPLTVGGGISSLEDAKRILNSGADKISVNTSAIMRPEIIKELSSTFGSQCVVVSIDAKHNGKFYEVFVKGGTERTGKDAIEWGIEAERLGAGEILLTSIDKDGTCEGFDLELTKILSIKVNIPIIASGGGFLPEHFYEIIKEGGASAVLAATVFHYGHLRIPDLKIYLKKIGINVRI